jgi:hypothetical protein
MSLILAGALLFGAYAAVNAFQSANAKDRNTAVALAEVARGQAQVRELIEQLKARDAELKAEHGTDQANTAIFLANQAAGLRFQAEELAWTRRLLNFVRTHPGQQIPASLLAAPSAPVLQRITPTPHRTSAPSRTSPATHHAAPPKKHRSHKKHGKKK